MFCFLTKSWMNLLQTFRTGLIFPWQSKRGVTAFYELQKCTFCSVFQLHLNAGLAFVWWSKIRGNNPILTLKLYVLSHFSPANWIYSKLLQQGYFSMTIKMRGKNPILTSKLYALSFVSELLLNKFAPKLLRQGLFFVCDSQKEGNNPILLQKLYVLFCFLTPSKQISSQLSEQGLFFQDSAKNTLMSLVVCVRYVVNNIFVQINILRCAYILTFFIMHMFAWVWYMHQNVHAKEHILRYQNIVTYTHKKNICLYTWMCLSMCICIY